MARMPRYRYTASDARGKTVRGYAEAPDAQLLYLQLRAQGYYLVSQRVLPSAAGRGLGLRRLAEFCRSLGLLLQAGVPIAEALPVLANEAGQEPRLKQLFHAIGEDLQRGMPLSDAMARQSPAFPPLLVGTLRSAEGTGALGRTALRMAAYYEKEEKLRRETANGLLYPAVLSVLIVVATAVLVLLVIPQFEPLFATLEQLPWATRMLLGFCRYARENRLLLLLQLATALLAVRCLFLVPAVRCLLDRARLCLPVAGRLNRKVCTARFARTLASLYACGVPVPTALAAGRDTVGNRYVAAQLEEVLHAVEAGYSLSEAVFHVAGFEQSLPAAIAVGEQTGELAALLDSVSDTLDLEAESAVKRLIALLEPATILVLAGVVLFVILAIILPIYQSYAVLG